MVKRCEDIEVDVAREVMERWITKASESDLERLAEYVDERGGIDWVSALAGIKGLRVSL